MRSLEEYQDRAAYPEKTYRKAISEQGFAKGMAELAAIEMKRHKMRPGAVPRTPPPCEMAVGIKRRGDIIAFLEANGPATTSEIVSAIGTPYNSLRNHLATLTSNKGIHCQKGSPGIEATYSIAEEQ